MPTNIAAKPGVRTLFRARTLCPVVCAKLDPSRVRQKPLLVVCVVLLFVGQQEKRAFQERRDRLILLQQQKEYQRMIGNIQRCRQGVTVTRRCRWVVVYLVLSTYSTGSQCVNPPCLFSFPTLTKSGNRG